MDRSWPDVATLQLFIDRGRQAVLRQDSGGWEGSRSSRLPDGIAPEPRNHVSLSIDLCYATQIVQIAIAVCRRSLRSGWLDGCIHRADFHLCQLLLDSLVLQQKHLQGSL